MGKKKKGNAAAGRFPGTESGLSPSDLLADHEEGDANPIPWDFDLAFSLGDSEEARAEKKGLWRERAQAAERAGELGLRILAPYSLDQRGIRWSLGNPRLMDPARPEAPVASGWDAIFREIGSAGPQSKASRGRAPKG